MVGFEYESERSAGQQTDFASKHYGFFAKQLRFGVKGKLAEDFSLNLSVDFQDALEPRSPPDYNSPPYLRTASLDYKPSRRFRLKMGRFKRPFSRLELEGAGDLPIIDRGLFNGLAIERNQWGDRALGAMASGRVKSAGLRWSLALTNPGWASSSVPEGVDVIARAVVSLPFGVSLGINGGYKRVELGGQTVHATAVGGDVRLKLGPARVIVEGALAKLPVATRRPYALGVLLLAYYGLPLSADWQLQPTVFAEYVDADTKFSETESTRLTLGLNLIGHGAFRVMPQLSLVRSLGDTSSLNPWQESESAVLVFSLER
jgi:hypothetical protein